MRWILQSVLLLARFPLMIAPLGSVALAIAFFENCSSHTVPPVFSIYVVFATNTISKDQPKVERKLQSKTEKDRGKNY